jgi:hypothetical protein
MNGIEKPTHVQRKKLVNYFSIIVAWIFAFQVISVMEDLEGY